MKPRDGVGRAARWLGSHPAAAPFSFCVKPESSWGQPRLLQVSTSKKKIKNQIWLKTWHNISDLRSPRCTPTMADGKAQWHRGTRAPAALFVPTPRPS